MVLNWVSDSLWKKRELLCTLKEKWYIEKTLSYKTQDLCFWALLLYAVWYPLVRQANICMLTLLLEKSVGIKSPLCKTYFRQLQNQLRCTLSIQLGWSESLGWVAALVKQWQDDNFLRGKYLGTVRTQNNCLSMIPTSQHTHIIFIHRCFLEHRF